MLRLADEVYLEVHSFTRSKIFADDVAMTVRHVASVGKCCAYWVSSGGVSHLFALHKSEDLPRERLLAHRTFQPH